MFNGIALLNREVIAGKSRVAFNIKDTCFSQDIELFGPTFLGAPYFEPVAILKAYTLRKLNAARNLAIYYITLGEEKFIDHDLSVFENNFPSLEYGTKHIRSVRRYYQDMKTLIREYERQEAIEKQVNDALYAAFES
jgi:hypothetical protein